MPDDAALGKNVAKAVGWAAFSRFSIQLVNWAITLAVIRLLKPEDYGLQATSMAITGFLQSIGIVGFADAIIQRRSVEHGELRSLFGLVITINLSLFAVLQLLASSIAGFYGEPELTLLLRVSGLIFIFSIFTAIPNALLMRALDMRSSSRVEIAANVVGSFVVLGLALAGAGVWALMIGFLSIACLRAVGLNLVSPWIAWPSLGFVREGALLRFGAFRTGEQLLWYFYSSADVLILGKLLGAGSLGIYSVARDLAAIPVEKLAAVVKPVAFPAFARMQHDRAEAVGYLSRASELLAFITFPVFFGMAAVSEDIVGIVLGPTWSAAVLPLQLLAFGMLLRPIGLIVPSFLQGLGEVRASFNNTLLAAIMLPAAFAIGAFWGVEGVCIAWIAAYPLQFLSLMRRVAIVTGVGLVKLLRPLLEPLVCAAAMYAVVVTTHHFVLAATPASLRLPLLIATGAASYGALALLLLRPLMGRALALARGR